MVFSVYTWAVNVLYFGVKELSKRRPKLHSKQGSFGSRYIVCTLRMIFRYDIHYSWNIGISLPFVRYSYVSILVTWRSAGSSLMLVGADAKSNPTKSTSWDTFPKKLGRGSRFPGLWLMISQSWAAWMTIFPSQRVAVEGEGKLRNDKFQLLGFLVSIFSGNLGYVYIPEVSFQHGWCFGGHPYVSFVDFSRGSNPIHILLFLSLSKVTGWKNATFLKIYPGRFTAGSPTNHPWKERKMIWTKPPWGHGTQPGKSSGVYDFFGCMTQLMENWGGFSSRFGGLGFESGYPESN